MARSILPFCSALALASFSISGCIPAASKAKSGNAVSQSAEQPAQAEPPAPIATPVVPAPTPAPVLPVSTGAWMSWPAVPGSWLYRQDTRGSIALFGMAGQNALVMIRCNTAEKAIFLSRIEDSGARQMRITTSFGNTTLPAGVVGTAPTYTAARLAPTSLVLDQMAFSRGRFAIEIAGLTPLAIPSHAEMARVVEDCRK